MSTSMVNMSTRLEEDLHNVVIDLKSKGQFGSVLRLLLGALKQDKTATLMFLLGMGNPSISQNKLQDNVVRANLYERYLGLGIQKPFPEWVSELSQVEIEVNSGLTFARVDLQEIITTIVEDLDLGIDSSSSAKSSVTRVGSSVSSTIGVDEVALENLLSKMLDARLSSMGLPIDKKEESKNPHLSRINPIEDEASVVEVESEPISQPVVSSGDIVHEFKPVNDEPTQQLSNSDSESSGHVEEVQSVTPEDEEVTSSDSSDGDVLAFMDGMLS